MGTWQFTAHDRPGTVELGYTNRTCRGFLFGLLSAPIQAMGDNQWHHEVNLARASRPELIFDYMDLGYRGEPITSKAQWDTGILPMWSSAYESFEGLIFRRILQQAKTSRIRTERFGA